MTKTPSSADAPILEFDPAPTAIIEPSMWHAPIDGLPRVGLITWMADAFDRLVTEHRSEICHRFEAETAVIEFHRVELPAGGIVAVLSHVGAPVATVLYETLVAIGVDTTVAIGSSGGLVAEHPPGTIVVPDAAIRDEGVSYHYAPPGRLAHPDRDLQAALRASFLDDDLDPIDGVLWTTDAFFRETPDKVAGRIDEGAVAVDMEAAALATVAAFRGVRHGHAVYMADTLHGDEWDPTELVVRNTDYRYRLLQLAARAGLAAATT